MSKDVVQSIMEDMLKDAAVIGAVVTNTEAEPLGFLVKDENHHREIITAATAALVSLSKQSFSRIMNDETDFILNYTDKIIYITIPEEEIILTVLIDRYHMGTTKLERYIDTFKAISRKIEGTISATKYAKKSIIGLTRQEIPEAKAIAVVSRDGVPIAMDTRFDPALISGLISAFFTSSTSFSSAIEVSLVIGREDNTLILYNIDGRRILAVVVPQGRGSYTYIPKIRKIVDESQRD